MESLDQDLAAMYSWCLKCNMKINPKKSMVASRCRINASGYDYLALAGAEFEEVESLIILDITLDF